MKVGFLARGLALAAAILALCPAYSTAGDRDDIKFRKPLVIGHRGAHGYLPAHTLEGYALAIELGADFIEPDLVATRDGHLIASHEPNLIATTDVASRPEYASRRRTVVIDGAAETGFFASDFSLVEIKRLRRVQDFADRPQQFNGKFEIPTLEEIIALVKRKSGESGRTIGIYPETKHPSYFQSIGLPLEDELLKHLAEYGFKGRNDKVFIQSFETANLRALRKKTSIRLIQLIDASGAPYDFVANHDPRTYGDLVKPDGLKWISQYADGIGPALTRIIPVDANNHAQPPTTLVKDAHHAGLAVHPWTVRPENSFLPVEYRQGNPSSPNYLNAEGDAARLLAEFYKLGVDGIFSDDSALAVASRHRVFG